MTCPRCNSENVQVQSQEYKPKLTVPILMIGGGFGLMLLGLIGLIGGLIIGVIVAAIVSAVIPQTYRPVVVCQQCGFVGTPTTIAPTTPNPIFCTPGECNLRIVRSSSSTGTVCALGIKIDNFAPFEIGDGDMKFIKLAPGTHRVSYYQVNGLGKDKRKGFMDVVIGGTARSMYFEFLPNGLNVTVR